MGERRTAGDQHILTSCMHNMFRWRPGQGLLYTLRERSISIPIRLHGRYPAALDVHDLNAASFGCMAMLFEPVKCHLKSLYYNFFFFYIFIYYTYIYIYIQYFINFSISSSKTHALSSQYLVNTNQFSEGLIKKYLCALTSRRFLKQPIRLEFKVLRKCAVFTRRSGNRRQPERLKHAAHRNGKTWLKTAIPNGLAGNFCTQKYCLLFQS